MLRESTHSIAGTHLLETVAPTLKYGRVCLVIGAAYIQLSLPVLFFFQKEAGKQRTMQNYNLFFHSKKNSDYNYLYLFCALYFSLLDKNWGVF